MRRLPWYLVSQTSKMWVSPVTYPQSYSSHRDTSAVMLKASSVAMVT